MNSFFQLASPSFGENQTIPPRHTCEGEGVSPELAWSRPPSGVQSFALVMHDPDTAKGDVTHWLLWDIPASECSLAEGTGNQSTGATGANQHDDITYLPPTPPRGDPPHRYIFELYALDVATLALPRGSARKDFETAVGPHVITAARLTGHFGRPRISEQQKGSQPLRRMIEAVSVPIPQGLATDGRPMAHAKPDREPR